MKTTIEVMAVGQRKQGVSKTKNQPYDFTEVSICYDNPYGIRYGFTTGRMAEIVTIDQSVLSGLVLKPGDVFEAEVFEQFYKLKVGAIYGRD